MRELTLLSIALLFTLTPAVAQNQSCDVSPFLAAPFTVYFTFSAAYDNPYPPTVAQHWREQAQGQATMTPGNPLPNPSWIGIPVVGTGNVSFYGLGDTVPFAFSAQGAFLNDAPSSNNVILQVDTSACQAALVVRYSLSADSPGGTLHGGTDGGANPALRYPSACITLHPFSLTPKLMSGSFTCSQQATGILTQVTTATLSWSTSPLTLPATCDLTRDLGLPNSVTLQRTYPYSQDLKPTRMQAFFNPTANGIPITLTAAAQACGFTGFNWQQLVERLPPPSNPSACLPLIDPDGTVIYPCPTSALTGATLNAPPAFFDAPNGGLTYLSSRNFQNFMLFTDAYPYYFNAAAASAPPITSKDGNTLYYEDNPEYRFLSPGDHLSFKTRLVGLKPSSLFGVILHEWTWTSDYSGTNGGVGYTSNFNQADGTGTGGVTITSINGVPVVVNFSTFSSKLEARSTSFELKSIFTLGGLSDGINPLNEVTMLEVGTYSATIPPQSFHKTSKGFYVYEGKINGVKIELQIIPSKTIANTYTLEAEVAGVQLNLANPLNVLLEIGNDTGAGVAVLHN